MKQIVVIRHGEKEDDRLTQYGVAACRLRSQSIGHFDKVISSDRMRCVQTAELLTGVTPEIDIRASVPDFPKNKIKKLELEQLTHPLGIVGAVWEDKELVDAALHAGQNLKELITKLFESLDENQRALIVSHDVPILAAEKLFLNESFDSIDHNFKPLEGILINDYHQITYI